MQPLSRIEVGPKYEYAEIMLKEEPFDPLIFLERQLLLTVRMDESGSILVYGVSGLSPEKQKQVGWVVRSYAGLLRLQLKASKPELRPSVQKLMAQQGVENLPIAALLQKVQTLT